ncbi:MAG TPA: GerMN domain-containing protein [Acidimicrobiales bacterium]|nr:GerMN domain-containing protein [Acidimicrobiales bacterium]
MRRLLCAVALVALAATLTSCAIPTQSSPNTIANSKVPFNLMDKHPPTTSTTQPNTSSYVPVKVYLLDSTSALTPAQRFVPPPAPLIAVLRALLVGPTSSETASGITTAIPSNVEVLGVSSQSGVVTVNLNSAFEEITGPSTQLAVGQIVWTIANEVGWNTGVVFEIEGQRTDVPIANGSLVPGPVYYLQFFTPPPA